MVIGVADQDLLSCVPKKVKITTPKYK